MWDNLYSVPALLLQSTLTERGVSIHLTNGVNCFILIVFTYYVVNHKTVLNVRKL